MRGCSPWLNHTLGEDGTWFHGSVVARPIEWQQEISGRSPFSRVCLLCTMHVLSAGRLLRCADARPAKARIRREWDLVSRIGRIKTHRMAARSLGRSPFPRTRLLRNVHCACQDWMQFLNQSSDAWRSGRVLQSIHTSFSQHPDVMQASTDLIWQLHLYFQQGEPKLPIAFMTGCSNTKSWMKAETWVDDRLGPWQHILSVLVF
jgi:hypothetical protein